MLYLIIGTLFFVKELIDVHIWLDLFFDRWRVPEAMRALQKRCDLSLSLGHLSAALFGLSLMVAGLARQQEASAVVTPLLAIISLVLAANGLEKLIFARRYSVRDRIEEIQQRWKRQKRFSPEEHDHEVNLYRGLTASLTGRRNAMLLLAGELLICLIIR